MAKIWNSGIKVVKCKSFATFSKTRHNFWFSYFFRFQSGNPPKWPKHIKKMEKNSIFCPCWPNIWSLGKKIMKKQVSPHPLWQEVIFEWLWPFLKLNWNQPNPTPTPGEQLFLSSMMLDLHQMFRISSTSSTNMIYDVKMTPILQSPRLQSGTINILQVPPYPFSAKSCRIFIKLSGYLFQDPSWLFAIWGDCPMSWRSHFG